MEKSKLQKVKEQKLSGVKKDFSHIVGGQGHKMTNGVGVAITAIISQLGYLLIGD